MLTLKHTNTHRQTYFQVGKGHKQALKSQLQGTTNKKIGYSKVDKNRYMEFESV